jgi:hypothetical protein
MPHITIEDATTSVEIQARAVVSKVVHRDEDVDVTVFGFDTSEGLAEHRAARPAIVQVLSGGCGSRSRGTRWRWFPAPGFT